MSTEHISIRVPGELLAVVRQKAEAEDRSVSWVVVEALRKEYGKELAVAAPKKEEIVVEATKPQTAREKFIEKPECPNGKFHRFLPSGKNFWCVDCKVLYEMEEGDE